MKNVTQSSFEADVLNADGPVLVDFYADWCGPCKRLAPVLKQWDDAEDALTIVKVNIDEEPALAAAFGVSSIPALKLFKSGEVVQEANGAHPLPALKEQFTPYL